MDGVFQPSLNDWKRSTTPVRRQKSKSMSCRTPGSPPVRLNDSIDTRNVYQGARLPAPRYVYRGHRATRPKTAPKSRAGKYTVQELLLLLSVIVSLVLVAWCLARNYRAQKTTWQFFDAHSFGQPKFS